MSPRSAPTTRRQSPRARLLEAVGSSATELLAEGDAVTADELAATVRSTHAKLVDEVAKAASEKLVKSAAKSAAGSHRASGGTA